MTKPMTSTYFKNKGITIAQVAQFCKDCSWPCSNPYYFLLAADLLVRAKIKTCIDEPKPVGRFGFILNRINLN